MRREEEIIRHTQNWVIDVVVGLNFCPFAAKEVKRGSVHYIVAEGDSLDEHLEILLTEFSQLDQQDEIETTLIIFPDSYTDFNEYLNFVNAAEDELAENGYEGIYQVASFHPEYLFSGSSPDDAANYTNRSPYPMLHLLREESLSRVIDAHPDIDSIPERNIHLARQKGLHAMQMLRESCFRHIS